MAGDQSCTADCATDSLWNRKALFQEEKVCEILARQYFDFCFKSLNLIIVCDIV